MKLMPTRLGLSLVSLALVLGSALAAGCGGDDEASVPTIDCATVTVPTYSQVTLFATVCTDCHSSDKTGADRSDAPVDVNFDTYEAAKAKAQGAVEQVYAGNMPPGGITLPEADKQALYAWGLCGTPE